MQHGDTVLYLPEPDLYGAGRYVDTTPDGHMVIEFTDGTRELFHPTELDTPARARLTPSAAA